MELCERWVSGVAYELDLSKQIDFGDCPLNGIVQTIDFGCWSFNWNCPDMISGAIYYLELSKQ